MSQAPYTLTFMFEFEREQLLAALRRDYRAEVGKYEHSNDRNIEHYANARNNLRLLETLNPKRAVRAAPVQRLSPPVVHPTAASTRKEAGLAELLT